MRPSGGNASESARVLPSSSTARPTQRRRSDSLEQREAMHAPPLDFGEMQERDELELTELDAVLQILDEMEDVMTENEAAWEELKRKSEEKLEEISSNLGLNFKTIERELTSSYQRESERINQSEFESTHIDKNLDEKYQDLIIRREKALRELSDRRERLVEYRKKGFCEKIFRFVSGYVRSFFVEGGGGGVGGGGPAAATKESLTRSRKKRE